MRIVATRNRSELESLAKAGQLKFGSAGIFYNSKGWVRDSEVFEYPAFSTVVADESGVYVNHVLFFERKGDNWYRDDEIVSFSQISIEIA